MRTTTEIDSEILKLREELEMVRGRPTEVYTRIVGYYRSLRNWNKGKREEYNHRKLFIHNDCVPTAALEEITKKEPQASTSPASSTVGPALRFMYFYRETCPNCPPVRELIAGIDMPGCDVDVETDEGFAAAVQHTIYATPTVAFFDGQSNEVFRATDLAELKRYLQSSGLVAGTDVAQTLSSDQSKPNGVIAQSA